jgi:hypothetical protein
MNNLLNNYDLDDYVSLAIEFREDKNYADETINTMEFHFADDNFGVKWYPTKKTINSFIGVLKNIESKMTDATNLDPDED